MNSAHDLTEVLDRHPFTFAVVRHPWQRLVSAYLDFKTRSRNPENNAGKLARGSFFWVPESLRPEEQLLLHQRWLCQRKQPSLALHGRVLLVLCSQLHRDIDDGVLR